MSNYIPHFQNMPWLQERTIFLTRHGSHAYGLATPTSDLDIKGVAIPPREYFLGFFHRFEQAEAREPNDLVIYELRKFFTLASNCNPNIIEVLWTDPEDHLLVTPLGERLLAHRDAFLSRKARHTFSGYAMSQLKRIQTHRRWLVNPPTEAPTRAEFGLPERTVISRDQLMAAESQIQKKLDEWDLDLTELDPALRQEIHNRWAQMLAEMQLGEDKRWMAAARQVGYDENFLELLERERRYRTRSQDWAQYNEWKLKRNPARAALEAKYGFDAKHASHLVRLMRMCREILETGEVRVRRPDREEILGIRNGAWSYDQLIAWAEQEDKALDEAARTSPLPRGPDRDALDALCIELVEAALAS
jgi:predicted nucleotidyltransferase